MKDSWKISNLENLVIGKGEYGLNAPACEYNTSLLTYLRITDISENGRFIEKEKKSVNHPLAGKYILEKGDIVFARTGNSTGKTYLFDPKDGKLVFAGFLIRFKPNPQKLDSAFLKYITQTPEYKNWVSVYSARTGQPGINGNEYGKLKIKHPPLPQQRKIANILTTCDTVIEKTEAAIAKYRAIKQGMMHDLFTRGIVTESTTYTDKNGKEVELRPNQLRPKYEEAPELYKESELGWIPKEWEVKKMKEYIGMLKSGLSRLLSQQDIGIPVLISGNIQNGKVDFSDLRYWHLKDPQGAKIENYILNPGDILLCFINSVEQIGKLAIFNGFERSCIYTTNLFRIVPNHFALSEFLYYLLSSFIVQNEIQLITKPAVNQASFTTKDFLKIRIPFISKVEQELIEKRLVSIDKKIQTEQSTLSKYREIKTGLMQDLLSGEVEVVV